MPGFAAEQRIPADGRVITLSLPLDNQIVKGKIVSYSTLTFTIQAEEGGKLHSVLWNAIPAANVDRYWRFLERPDGDGDALFELGDILIRHPQGEALAEKAFKQALEADPTLEEAVQRSREGKAPDGSPRYVGTADPEKWGELSPQQMEAGNESLRAYCKKVQKELGIKLSLYESERFMVLTDVEPERVQAMSGKLTDAYQAVAELLGDDPQGNVFYGKCLIALFSKRVDYLRFQRDLHDTDARGTGGMCHGFGDGHVHVAVVNRSSQRQTNHVVIHEVVHAYLHRYRSPVPVDDWLNEGLAEYFAHQTEPPPGQNLYLKARLSLEGKKGLGDGFFETDKLAAWQYDVAGALTGFMLEGRKDAYPELIQAIKEGKPAAEALERVYRMKPAVLTQRFKRRLDRELNKRLGG